MKVSFLLIILGFSQVLGRNYESLTESKSEREDQIEGKSSEDNNIEMGEMVNNNKQTKVFKPTCRARHCGDPEGRAKFLKKLTMGKFSILGVKSLLPFKAKLFQESTFFIIIFTYLK